MPMRRHRATTPSTAARAAMAALAAVAATAVLTPAASAQLPPPLNVEGVGEPVSVNVAMHRGYPAYPAWVLRALGARVDQTGRGTRVVLDADTISFEAGSPFFHHDGRVWQLVEPAYEEGGVFYLPHQLFAEWLPARFDESVRYADGHLMLSNRAVEAGTDPGKGGSGGNSASSATAPAGDAPTPAGPDPLGRPAGAPLVIIDPGHGGSDPGRIGPSGLKEKDIVLQVSKRLARELAERGYEIRMTRTTDTLIGLYDRAPMANRWRGDRPGLFLSIHANGVSDRRANGFETFFLSDPKTEDERRVAEMENASLAYESPNRPVSSAHTDVILNGLLNDFFVQSSYTLAGLVQEEMSGFHRGHNRGVKQAGFVVLIGAFMPAVLVELAFMSNPAEERLLGSGTFQVESAKAIADAVDRFFETQGDLWTDVPPG